MCHVLCSSIQRPYYYISNYHQQVHNTQRLFLECDDGPPLLPQLVPLRVQVLGLHREVHVLVQVEPYFNARYILWSWGDVDNVKLPQQRVVGRHRVIAVQHQDAGHLLVVVYSGEDLPRCAGHRQRPVDEDEEVVGLAAVPELNTKGAAGQRQLQTLGSYHACEWRQLGQTLLGYVLGLVLRPAREGVGGRPLVQGDGHQGQLLGHIVVAVGGAIGQPGHGRAGLGVPCWDPSGWLLRNVVVAVGGAPVIGHLGRGQGGHAALGLPGLSGRPRGIGEVRKRGLVSGGAPHPKPWLVLICEGLHRSVDPGLAKELIHVLCSCCKGHGARIT
mmetsp:Transcript_31381/g.69857  ORF Transcript_31381/g.69857 Transcript_31381/m.69857 type:complete len:330 (-) Transcript_31381:396-1385(-)